MRTQEPIADLPREELLEKDIIEGCREMADVYLELQCEFDPLDAELTRTFSPEPIQMPASDT